MTHLLLVAQLRQWLDGPTTSPAESVRKKKLKRCWRAERMPVEPADAVGLPARHPVAT